MKYYQVHFIEGSDNKGAVELEPNHALMWAKIEGRTLLYKTNSELDVAERKITRAPRFFDDGFACEVEEKGVRCMLRFKEYYGEPEVWQRSDGAAFKKVKA